MTTMRLEIDILLRAAAKECGIVEKASFTPWSAAELAQAHSAGHYREQSDLVAPERRLEGAHALLGGKPKTYRVVGQTRHFLILAARELDPSAGQLASADHDRSGRRPDPAGVLPNEQADRCRRRNLSGQVRSGR
jgi:hypothetical protein